MSRPVAETLIDLDTMESLAVRVRSAIYAKAFLRGQYDEALARVRADLGGCLSSIELLLPAAEPEELIAAIGSFIDGRDKVSDIPQTSPPGGPW